MVKKKPYIPDRGDLVWVNFNPQKGHEQANRRPAIVLTPQTYNKKTSLAIVCPLTSHVKGYPFEVRIPPGLPVGGVVLADQVKSLDWRVRKAKRIGAAPPEVTRNVLAKIHALVGKP